MIVERIEEIRQYTRPVFVASRVRSQSSVDPSPTYSQYSLKCFSISVSNLSLQCASDE